MASECDYCTTTKHSGAKETTTTRHCRKATKPEVFLRLNKCGLYYVLTNLELPSI